MAIVRGASTTNEVNGATTVDLAVPAAAVGDVVLFTLGASVADTAVGADVALTKATAVTNAANESITVWYRVIDGTEPVSYTFTGLSGRTSAAAVAYSGVDTAVVLDSAPGTGTGTATASATVTTAADNALLFGVGLVDAATAADISAPPEQTQIWKATGTGRRTVVSDETLATAGAVTRTWTQTATLAMAVALVPLREAAPTIAFRSLGQVQVWSTAPSSTFVVPKPAGLAVGDLMMASVTTNGTGITLPAGWTDLYPGMNTLVNPEVLVCYKIADAADVAAIDFTFTTAAATYGSAEICAYSGVDQSTPIDFTTTPFVSSADTTTFTVPAGTTVTDGAVLVGGASANTGVSSSSWTLPASPTAWVEEWNPATGAGGAVAQSGGKSHIRGRCEPALPAGSTTGAMTFTLSVARAGSAWAVGLRPAVGGAPAPASGSTAGSMSLGGSATGATTASGSGSGSLALTGSATGSAAASGATSGSLALSGTATGTAPVVTANGGSASGLLSLTGSATGSTSHTGATTGTLTLAGTATGADPAAVRRDLRLISTGPPTLAATTLAPVGTTLTWTDPTSPTTTGQPDHGWVTTEPDL